MTSENWIIQAAFHRGIDEGRRQMPAESVPPLHPVVQECIDNYGKYYAEQHKLGMSVRSDMIYVAQLALRWADNAAAGHVAVSVEALRFAKEFVADPEKRAQVKVQLAANGWPQLSDLIDEAVIVSRELLRLNAAAGSGGQCVNVPRKLLEEILEHKSRMQYYMAMPYEGGNALDCVVRNILRESAQTAGHCQPAAPKEQG